MNKISKPKMTSKDLVNKLRDEKGVTFKYIAEEEAEKKLSKISKWRNERQIYRFGFCVFTGVINYRHAFKKFDYENVH